MYRTPQPKPLILGLCFLFQAMSHFHVSLIPPYNQLGVGTVTVTPKVSLEESR